MDICCYIDKLIGRKVLTSRAGGGAGSILLIETEGESFFFIWCDWRIEKGDHVISTSLDDTTAVTGPVARSAKLLDNRVILSIEMTKQYDLIIKFEKEYCLRVFCLISYSRAKENTLGLNWELSFPKEDLSFEITNKFEVRMTKYY